MLLEIPELLNSAQIDKLQEILAQGSFVDGRLTAGMAAGRVKNNLELQPEPELLQRLNRIVMASLGHSSRFRAAVLPHRMADFIFSRYEPGMAYGDHVDDPVMGGGKFRSDVSMTVFLNPPADYDGGELVIRTTFGDRAVKLPAGHAVVYPSSSVHRVTAVTRGERSVALTWIQSMVRDAARRELLFELDQARAVLLKAAPDAVHSKQVDRAYVNLLRMWSDV